MSEITESFLYNVPALVKDYIYTDEYFRQFPIVLEDDAEITADLDQALHGLKAGPTTKTGLAIFISSARGGRPIQNTPDTFSEGARVLFEIVEVPDLNRSASAGGTGQPGKVVAEVLAATMKNFATADSDFTNLHFYEGEIYMPETVELPNSPAAVIHRLLMLCNGGLEDVTTVVATPVITDVALTVTITTATGGASIYYTIDGTRPQFYGAGNVNNVGTLYAAPFMVADGTTVRARAVKTGMRSSAMALKLVVN